MNKIISLALLIVVTFAISKVHAQTDNEEIKAVKEVMAQQEKSWNEGDVNAFMQGYWKSDSLLFVGGKGAVYGWTKTLNNYLKSYPDQAKMGKLKFENIKIEILGNESAFIVGKWHLERAEDELGGWYSLLWKKIEGKWKIVADHSSSL